METPGPLRRTQPPKCDLLVRMNATKLFQEAWSSATVHGWAECAASLAQIAPAVGCGFVSLPTRPGDPEIGRLEARSTEHARLSSLSGRYGRGQFPLHTDGAHLRNPPDATLIEFDQSTSTAPTWLYALRPDDADASLQVALDHGVFDIGMGSSVWLGPARSDGRIRFDPVAMRPRDPLAHLVVRFFETAVETSTTTYCSKGHGMTLVIDNRQTLHGRSEVQAGQTRTARRLMLRYTEE